MIKIMFRFFIFLLIVLPQFAIAQNIGGGSSSFVIGSTIISGSPSAGCVIYVPTTTPSCGSTLTYSGTVLNVPAGSASLPALSVGIATTGMYSASTTQFGVSVNGASKMDYGITGGAGTWFIDGSAGGFVFMGGTIQTAGNFNIGNGNVKFANTGGTSGSLSVLDGSSVSLFDYGVTTASTLTVVGNVTSSTAIRSPLHVATGSVPTGTTGSCTTGVTVAGGSTAGTWTSTATCAATGTIILTAMPTAPTGYACFMTDRTTSGATIQQTATSATSATFTVRSLPTGSVTVAANDILQYHCIGY